MDRRELFGRLGIAGAGLAMGASAASADDHGKGAAGSPVGGGHAHFCGIHIAKKDPKFQLVTQHFCVSHGEGHGQLFQCLLYDSNSPGAKLLGVEYIISDEQYRGLPDEEKKYWHAHSYEVLGGGLIAPSMPPEQEKEFMKGLLTTWGKAWHTWPDPTTPIPMGEPLLIWSLMGDGQVDPKIVEARDKEFGISSEQIAATRRKEIGYESPKVSAPTSMDQVGRQWTDEGKDEPTRLK